MYGNLLGEDILDHLLKTIAAQPGIQRDGTQFDTNSYVDGQWCRFYLGKPKKMGGMVLTSSGTSEPIRNLYVVAKQDEVDVYLGQPYSLNVVNTLLNGLTNSPYERTPANFAENEFNEWTFDQYTLLNAPQSVHLGNDPLSVTITSDVVVVTVPSTQGMETGDEVTITGATDTGGILAADLNITAEIIVIDGTSFSYEAGSVASSTATGGGTDVFYNTTANITYIVAVAAPNSQDMNNRTEGLIYWGDIQATTPLVPIAASNPKTSGGIVVLYPFLFKYGNDGVVTWTDDPTDWSNAQSAAIDGEKIIKGMRTRGGSNSPAALFWSLNSLIRCTFVGDTVDFQFDTIQDDISVLSASTIVTYNNIFFWIGVDQFYIYNGVVQKLDNPMSTDYFFDNINMDYRERAWGMVMPRFNEIWWFYPRGTATECTHAIIYNYQLKTWYDTELARSAGFPAAFYPYPLMADAERTVNITQMDIQETINLGSNPITTSADSPFVTLTLPSTKGILAGDSIIVAGATDTGGITAAKLNIQAKVLSATPTTLTYEIQGFATSTTTGGGGGVTVQYDSNNTFALWTHEKGINKIYYNQVNAIPSHFETNITSYFDSFPQDDRQMRVRRIEPDFNQVGDMRLIIKWREFAQSTVVNSNTYTFVPGQTVVELAKVDTYNMGRLVNFRFESNTTDGYYMMGKVLVNFAPGDVRP